MESVVLSIFPIRPSALAHPEEVRTYLDKEIERGHTKGPFLSAPFSDFVSSPLACIPKKDGSLRLILDLSAPMGQSINDGISAGEFKLTYVKFDSIVKMITSHGKGALLAKVDLKHAFRQCPVRPADWPLLGYTWEDKYYFDVRLPFGHELSTSPI